MPWCQPCSKYLTPTALRADGSCPACGEPVAEHHSAQHESAPHTVGDDAMPAVERTPWHFKLLVGAVAVYLGWRLIEMIGWIA